MKHTKNRIIGLLLLFLGTLLLGCTTRTSRDSSIPWSQPASWEGQIPGISNPDS